MKKENKSFSVYIVAGILAGVLSFFLNNQAYALLSMVVVAAVLVKVLERFLGKEKIKWWLTNGLWIYFLLWVISWTVLYNI